MLDELLLIGAAIAIEKFFTKLTEESYNRWIDSHKDLKEEIESHRLKIEKKMEEAKQRADYQELVDLHFDSFLVANKAYELLNDARTTLDAIGKLIVEAKLKRDELTKTQKTTQKDELQKLSQEIHIIAKLRRTLFTTRDAIRIEKKDLFTEVKQLNEYTHELKLRIRDCTGEQGMEWFERLEERRRHKKDADKGFNIWKLLGVVD